jgi:N-acetylglucosamine kinase-like BadF-type ATPase
LKHYYLGVDGGQSSTVALIADETGHVVGSGRGGACNHVSGPEARQKFLRAIGGCLEQACREAGIEYQKIVFQSACLGFSGGAADKEAYSRELIRSRKLKITHDAEIALSGATAGEPGIIVIAGTGSMAFGRNSEGRFARAGGWGYVFGDEGGGFDLARRTLRAALRFEEGWGATTALHPMLLEATGSSDANGLMHRFYTSEFSRPQIAALSQLVSQAAEQLDSVALAILQEAANDLAVYVEGVHRNLFKEGEPVSVAYIGGTCRSRLLRKCFCDVITQRLHVAPKPPLMNPAAGALLDALRSDGNPAKLTNVPEFDKDK